MYSIFDKRNAVKEIQKYLKPISKAHLSQSGIYDEKTKEAVTIFQRKQGLPESGVVDNITFSLLYSEYMKTLLPKDFSLPVRFGTYSEAMGKINYEIKQALDYYGIYNSMRRSKYYSQETEYSVKKLRQIYNLEEKEEIDEQFYTRLFSDIKNM